MTQHGDIQLDSQGRLKHFLSIEGLSRALLTRILDHAEFFAGIGERAVKKVPLLRGKTIVNLFFEASTRTRTTFELAAKRLSADVLNINLAVAATGKGESLLDTLRTLEAMHCDMFVVRHASSGAAHFIAARLPAHISVINAGDGRHAHPTQAMLDMLTIRTHKKEFAPLRVAIVGDILHSRVARSEIHALNTLGVSEVRVIAPKTLLPKEIETLGVQVFHDLKTHHYGLTEEKLAPARENAIVMHPGPINRGIEISSSIADGRRSVILQQISHGIAIRMAVMAMTMGALSAPAAAGPS